jgi:alanyl-tRNA synthetase
LVVDGQVVSEAQFGDQVEVILPKTGFYLESGGQVSDTGSIRGAGWEIEISDVRRPAAGLIAHIGEVVSGKPKVGDQAVAEVDAARRHDIMRNHTATHLLHHALHEVLGEHARQAGSLVAPDRLRFDFNHPEAMTPEQVERVEQIVNAAVAADYAVAARSKSREAAIAEGAMALFGEKYGDVVRTITIAAEEQDDERYSYELCGGTHLERTSDVGMFLLVSEGSAAAGVRRIEAVTGRGAYELVVKRFRVLKAAAAVLKSGVDELPIKIEALQDELAATRKQAAALRAEQAAGSFEARLADVQSVAGVALLAMELPGADKEALGQLADKFRE